MEDQITEIVTGVVAVVSALFAGGLAAGMQRLKVMLRPMAARRSLKICIVAPIEPTRGDAVKFRDSLRRAGYTDVRITHAAASASGDIVILWQPPLSLESAMPYITAIRDGAPEAYLCIYVQGFIKDLKQDDMMHMVNSLLRLRADLMAIAEQVVADRQPA
jgi:hypothetical protein